MSQKPHTVNDCEPVTEYARRIDPGRGVYLLPIIVCRICGRNL